MGNKEKRVFIVNDYGDEYATMFKNYGWVIIENIKDADLIQFTGGEDVTPSFYGHIAHLSTHNNEVRDKKERLIFLAAKKMKKPMAGICRGGQFLNVMCGGSMWQDISGHCGNHVATYLTGNGQKKKITVTSTHHQMMVPINDVKQYYTLMTAAVCKRREKMHPLDSKAKTGPGRNDSVIMVKNIPNDLEALCYYKQKVLCFQPHPEFRSESKELADLYFSYINMILLK